MRVRYKRFCYSPLHYALFLAICSYPADGAVYFNPAFLSDEPDTVADLSRFEDGGAQAPGKYRVDIYVNNEFHTTKDLFFKGDDAKKNDTEKLVSAKNDDTGLSACFTLSDLESFGVNVKAFAALQSLKKDGCIDISKFIPDAYTKFNFEQQRIDVSIPQAALAAKSRGYIPPERWQNGVSALLFNYNFTGSNNKTTVGNQGANNNYFLGLNSGANLGAWRLRDYSTWNYTGNNSSQNKWKHVSTYLQRAIVPIKGELTIGDNYTSGDIFDSLGFRGVQVQSDDNMLPDSMKGFAPTIRGIAKTNAQVTIQQNGYTIYQIYVPPGSFKIDDLYPTSSSGDLKVIVKETDGSINTYTVPYSAVPMLQREGRVKYAFTVAKYRNGNNQQDNIGFTQGSLVWGLPRGITVYGGTQLASKYHAFSIGSGINMGTYGAVSADITTAVSSLADDSRHKGQSLRFLYAKSLNNYGTNFQLLGYRYSTSGFYTLSDVAYKRMEGYTVDMQDGKEKISPDLSGYYNLYHSKRGKVQVNITQQLGDFGSLFFSGSRQSYWHAGNTDTLYQLGYNSTWRDINYSLSYNYNKSAGQWESDQIFSFSMSVPLGKWLGGGNNPTLQTNNAYANYSMNTDNHGKTTQTLGGSGTLLSDNNLNYSVQQGYGNHSVGASGNLGLNYRGSNGNSNLGYSYSNNGDYQQVNYGLSGGVVVHPHGITLSQPLGDTNVLISAPGAKNVSIDNSTGVKTDWRGYAVLPYATTYRNNRVALNTDSMANNIDVDDAVDNVVPTKGALVEARFNARVGVRALFTLLKNNKPIPFGAIVSRTDSIGASIVGDNGQVYLAGLPLAGVLNVKWGDGPDKRCVIKYLIPVEKENLSIIKESINCE